MAIQHCSYENRDIVQDRLECIETGAFLTLNCQMDGTKLHLVSQSLDRA